MDREQLIRQIEEQIHDLIHENGRHLGEDDWRQLFASVLASAFNGASDEPDE